MQDTRGSIGGITDTFSNEHPSHIFKRYRVPSSQHAARVCVCVCVCGRMHR